MTRYTNFNKLIKLTELTKTIDGYSKFIQRGNLEFYDYDVGFFDVNIYSYSNIYDEYFVRIWFGTIDDGDFGGWKKVDSKESAEILVERIALEIFKDMVSCPTTEEINVLLEPFDISVGYE